MEITREIATKVRPRLLTHSGKTMGIAAWAREIGINKESLRTRLLRGWSLEKALTTGATR